MELTFGKYKGFTLDQLARAQEGRDYLSWAEQNLRNPKWAAACGQALAETPYGLVDSDIMLSARVFARKYDDNLAEAESAIRDRIWEREAMEKEMAEYRREEDEAYEAAEAIFAEYAAKMGKTSAEVRKGAEYIHRVYESVEDVPGTRFSSPEARAQTVEMFGRLTGNLWWKTRM